MDYCIWIVLTLWIFIIQVNSQAWKISTACYGNEGLNCSFHHFECQSTDLIAVNGAEYFYKESTRCGMGVGNCDTHKQSCCRPEQDDCSLPYTRTDMARLKHCLRTPPCKFKTPWSTHKCIANRRLVQFSSYSVIFYECIHASQTIDFCEGSLVGNSVSIMYDPSKYSGDVDMTCACRTSGTREGHTPLFIEALDLHLGNVSTPHCSSLTMNSMDRDFVYACNSNMIHPTTMLVPVNATLPIQSELFISKINPPQRVWIRIQAKHSIKVTCKMNAIDKPSTYISVAEATSPKPIPQHQVSAVIGCSVGGLLCIAVLCVVVAYCVRKHRKQKAEKEAHEYFEIEPSGVFPIECLPDESDYHEIYENQSHTCIEPDQHYYSTADVLAKASRSEHAPGPFVISGYDHIHLTNDEAIPGSRMPNYGQLKDSEDVPDPGYNRLNDKGKVVFRGGYDRTSVAV